MPKINLTDAFVKAVKTEVRTEYWDTAKHSSVVLRVSKSGEKSWSVVYRRARDGQKIRLTLGKYPAVSLESARSKARAALEASADGLDPSDKKAALKASMTVKELGEEFIKTYAKPSKRTWPEDERILKNEVYPKIGKVKVAAVTRRMLLDIVQAKAAAGAPVSADRILATIRKMFSWAVDELDLEGNPATGIKPRAEKMPRERVLADTELKALWTDLNGETIDQKIADILRLLLLTGQRSGEVAGMIAGEVDLDAAEWLVPGERTKNGLPHIVPLSDSALTILRPRLNGLKRSDPVFTRGVEPMDPRFIAKVVRKNLSKGIDHWTPHDIRRTVSTGMAKIKVPPHVIEAALNHISGFKAGIAGTYNRYSYLPERRQALVKWEKHVALLTTNAPAKVVSINAA